MKDVVNIYESIIKDLNNTVHKFPIEAISLFIAFGYLLQNENSNITIYQYFENEDKWVYNEQDDKINIVSNFKVNGSNI